MAAIDELPQRFLPGRVHSRLLSTMGVIEHMRHGGTASQVRDGVVVATGESHSVDSISRALFTLESLGKVKIENVGNSRWYSAL